MPPRVVVELVRELADLHAWGRSEGIWWGLVSWRTFGCFSDGVNGYLHTSAWVPARLLDPSRDPVAVAEYQTVQRFDLPADRSAWPRPAATTGRRWRHCGPLEEPPPPPSDLTPLVGGTGLPTPAAIPFRPQPATVPPRPPSAVPSQQQSAAVSHRPQSADVARRQQSGGD